MAVKLERVTMVNYPMSTRFDIEQVPPIFSSLEKRMPREHEVYTPLVYKVGIPCGSWFASLVMRMEQKVSKLHLKGLIVLEKASD